MTRHPTADECARFVIQIADREIGRWPPDEHCLIWWSELYPPLKEMLVNVVHAARAVRSARAARMVV